MRYILLLLLFLPYSLFGRSNQESLTPIAVFLPDTQDGKIHGEFLEKKFQQNNHKANFYYSSSQDDQNSKIEETISENLKLIIIYSFNNDVNNITSAIIEKSIQIITYNRLIENNRNYFYYLTFDYEQMGRILAEKTIQKLPVSDTPYNFLILSEVRNRNQELIYTGMLEILTPYIRSGRIKPTIPIDNYRTLSISLSNDTILEAGIDKLLNLGTEIPDIVFSTNNHITDVINDKLDLVQPSEKLIQNIDRFAETAVLLCNLILDEEEVILPYTRHYKTDTELIMVDTYFIDPTF